MLLEVSKMLCTGRSLLLEEIVLEVCCGGTSSWLAGWMDRWMEASGKCREEPG